MSEMPIVWQNVWGYIFCSKLPYVVIHENASCAQKGISYFKLAEMWELVYSWVENPPNGVKIHQTGSLCKMALADYGKWRMNRHLGLRSCLGCNTSA